jgi:cell division protein ZapA (FtsZ GTPase activity inhibitor)
MENCVEREYEVLGHKVKFRPDEGAAVTADEVLNAVKTEVSLIKQSHPQLDNGQVAVLTALKISYEKLLQERDLTDQVQDIKKFANDALNFIEEVSPTAQ